jgi:uncharacterized membrane protein
MVLAALTSIHLFQHSWLFLSTLMLGLAINIKMSALLLVPGFLLVATFERGLIIALLTAVVMAVV